MKNFLKTILATAIIAAGLAAATPACADTWLYQSSPLVVTGLVINAATAGTTMATNLINANYNNNSAGNQPGCLTLHGGVNYFDLQTVYSQSSAGGSSNVTTSASQTLTATFQPILDDYSLVNHLPAGISNSFTVTAINGFSVVSNALVASHVSVAVTNNLGAKYAKLVTFTSGVTNNIGLTIQSCRAGYWYQP